MKSNLSSTEFWPRQRIQGLRPRRSPRRRNLRSFLDKEIKAAKGRDEARRMTSSIHAIFHRANGSGAGCTALARVRSFGSVLVDAPCSHLGEEAEAGAGAMLVACRLAGLSALETYYARVRAGAQFGAARVHSGRPFVHSANVQGARHRRTLNRLSLSRNTALPLGSS
jgi:hypothetical protein